MKKNPVILILMSIVILQILLAENVLVASKYYSYLRLSDSAWKRQFVLSGDERPFPWFLED